MSNLEKLLKIQDELTTMVREVDEEDDAWISLRVALNMVQQAILRI